MKVVLTQNPTDRGLAQVAPRAECACDCDCACPIEGVPAPVLALPAAYYLELTFACPNRCPGCGNVYAAERAALPAPLDGAGWRALITRLAGHAHQFKLTGGEPTFHPDFAAIVRAVDDLGVPFVLFTTGRWPAPDATLDLLRATSACEALLISLHGPDAATHDAFSGAPGAFAAAVAAIRRAADAGLPVAASCVLHRRTLGQIEATLALARRLGAHHVVYNRLIGAHGPELMPTPDELCAAIAVIERLRAAGQPLHFGNCIPQCFAPSSSTGCTAGSAFATVDPWGRLRPCNHAPLIAGDLMTQPVEAVWHGAVMQQWRALVPETCAGCAAFALCHGGCRAQALLTGEAQDPLIQAARPAPRVEEPLSLYAGLRPVGRYATRYEPQGVMLIRRSEVIAAPPDARTLPARLDGRFTLAQIAAQYGAPILDWIGALHQYGMVTWA
ncbi:MAG TPA: radical SAM protein [Anaerolineae bacterium]|nr:radical SAM protein [Anaerolineae bacterium]